MLMAFCSEINNYDDEHRDDSLKYDWETFIQWINELENKSNNDDHFISMSRLDWMHTTIYGMSSQNTAKKLLQKHRHRCTDKWDEPVEDTSNNHRNEILVSFAEDQTNNVVNHQEFIQLPTKETSEGMQISDFSDGIVKILTDTSENVESPMENNLMLNNNDEILLDISCEEITNTHKSVIEEIENSEIENSEIENSEIENSDESSNDDIDLSPELEDLSQDNFIEQKKEKLSVI